MRVWNVLHAAGWKYRIKNYAKNHLLRTTAQLWLYLHNQGMYRQSEKNLLNSNIFFTSPHNMVNIGLQTAEICSGVRGTPANFNEFLVLAALLHQRRAMEVNRTLHNILPCPSLQRNWCHLSCVASEVKKWFGSCWQRENVVLRPALVDCTNCVKRAKFLQSIFFVTSYFEEQCCWCKYAPFFSISVLIWFTQILTY